MDLMLEGEFVDDAENPVVWQRGKMLPDGQARVLVLHRIERDAIVKDFGQEWLDAFLGDMERELAKWGVH